MFEWIVKIGNNYRERFRVTNKRAVFLLWLEIGVGLLMVALLVVVVKIFLG